MVGKYEFIPATNYFRKVVFNKKIMTAAFIIFKLIIGLILIFTVASLIGHLFHLDDNTLV
jgi:hypothetical protein